jgi:adenylate kinase family enzyme
MTAPTISDLANVSQRLPQAQPGGRMLIWIPRETDHHLYHSPTRSWRDAQNDEPTPVHVEAANYVEGDKMHSRWIYHGPVDMEQDHTSCITLTVPAQSALHLANLIQYSINQGYTPAHLVSELVKIQKTLQGQQTRQSSSEETFKSGPDATRAEHLEWCKYRALQYCDAGKLNEALASIASDLKSHPMTANHAGPQMGIMLLMNGHISTAEDMRVFINGFN